MQPIDHYRISILLTTLVTGFLSLFVFLAAERTKLTRIYGLYTLAIFFWAVFFTAMMNSHTPQGKLISLRALHYPAMAVPFLFLYFAQTLLEIDNQPRQIRLRRIIGAISAAFPLVMGSRLFVACVDPLADIPYRNAMGPLYPVYTVFWSTAVLIAFYVLISGFRKSSGFRRTQIAHVIGAYTLGYSAVIGVFLPWYGYRMPVLSLYLIPVGHLWIMQAILRQQILEIRVVLRRTALVLAIYALFLVMLLPVIIYVHRAILGDQPNLLVPVALEVVFTGALFSTDPFLYARVVRRNVFFHETTIAGLTHELKTPLAAIESAAGFLSAHRPDAPLKADLKTYVTMIERNAERLRSSVENLTHVFGHDDRSKLCVERSDLRDLLRQSVASAQWVAEAKGLRIEVSVPEEPVPANVDSAKFEQIISNLVSNAIKFTDAGGIRIELALKPGQALIRLVDSGGFSPEEMPEIFDRFYQTVAGRRKKGTGLGLTIAKAWVEAHGGRIWAESEGLGKGTTVTFTVPL